MSQPCTNQSQDMLATVLRLGGDPADMPFWEGCRNGKFLLHRCNVCSRHYWPASRCVEHGDQSMAWAEISGRGQLYTYTVMHRVLAPTFTAKAPYTVGVIQLDEGPFFHSNIIDCDSQQLAVGMRVVAVMCEHDNGMIIPFFKPE